MAMKSLRTTIGDGDHEFGVTVWWGAGGVGIDVDGHEDFNGMCIVYVNVNDGVPELICNPDINAEEPLTIHFHEAASHLSRDDGDGSSHWDEVRKVIEQHNTYNHPAARLKED